MEVLSKTTSESPVLLSNFEVMSLLASRITNREEKQKKKEAEESKKKGHTNNKKNKASTKFQHRDWIEEKVFEYLQTTPCVGLESTSQMKELKSKLKSTKRQKKEKSKSSLSSGSKTSTKKNGKNKKIHNNGGAKNHKSNGNDSDTAEQQQDEDDVDRKISSITTGFGLTEAEAIQVLNFMPTELVDIHCMIHDLNSRLDETRQEELLRLIQSYCKNPISQQQQVKKEEEDQEEQEPNDQAQVKDQEDN